MALDQNLFTLNIVPQDENTSLLFDPMGVVYYRKERIAGPIYTTHVIDPISESTLATVTAPSTTSKHKTIELHNPSVPIQLTFVGTLTFRWAFKWEEHDFEWKREECFLIRKPDPPVLVAITSTKDSPGRGKTVSVQILDYNLNRFDIEDRKGLEIVILSALLSFQDAFDDSHAKREDPVSLPSLPSSSISNLVVTPEEVRARTPKPKKTGVEQVAERQKGDLQDITVFDEGEVLDYAQYCANFLETDNMLFITVQSSSAATVPKVLQIVQEVKRLRHISGDDSELHQYVFYDKDLLTGSDGKKRTRIIRLDDDSKSKKTYKPPQNLLVYLSKIAMPELETQSKPDSNKFSASTKTNTTSGKEKLQRPRSKSPEAQSSSSVAKVINRKFKSSSHLRSDDTKSSKKSNHYHPTPSPSQLNNPIIYTTSPPPPPPRNSNLLQPHSTSHPYPNSFYGPGPYPRTSNQQPRPISSYGDQRPTSPSIVSGLLDKLKSW